MKQRHQITMNPDVWDALGEFANELGSTRSALLELLARNLTRAESETIGKLSRRVVTEVVEMYMKGREIDRSGIPRK